MIIYLSAAMEPVLYGNLLKKGQIKDGIQAQRFNSLLIKGLARYEKVAAVSNIPGILSKDDIFTGYENENIRYYMFGDREKKFHKIVRLCMCLKQMIKILHSESIDFVVADAVNPLSSICAVVAMKLYGKTGVAVITDIPLIIDAEKGFFSRLAQWLMNKYDCYVLLSKGMLKYINTRGKSFLIMEGLCEPRDIFWQKRTEGVNKKICVYTGTIDQGNGIWKLCQAFEKINESILQLYGSGSLVEAIKDANFKNVEYKGVVTNEDAAYIQANADLLINPRPSDAVFGDVSFPSKLMEYMVSGTPVLSTKLPGIPEEYEQYIYYIDEESIQGVRKAIRDVLRLPEDERRVKGQMAKKFVVENKNIYVQSKRLIDLVKETGSDKR